MHVELDTILSGETRRAGKPQRQRVIENAAVFVAKNAIGREARLRQMSGQCDERLPRLRAGNANDGNGGATKGGRQRKNRFAVALPIHRILIVARRDHTRVVGEFVTRPRSRVNMFPALRIAPHAPGTEQSARPGVTPRAQQAKKR